MNNNRTNRNNVTFYFENKTDNSKSTAWLSELKGSIDNIIAVTIFLNDIADEIDRSITKLPDEVAGNQMLMEELIARNPKAACYASTNLLRSEEFMFSVIKRNPEAILYLSDYVQTSPVLMRKIYKEVTSCKNYFKDPDITIDLT